MHDFPLLVIISVVLRASNGANIGIINVLQYCYYHCGSKSQLEVQLSWKCAIFLPVIVIIFVPFSHNVLHNIIRVDAK